MSSHNTQNPDSGIKDVKDLMETGKDESVVQEREIGKKRGSKNSLETSKEGSSHNTRNPDFGIKKVKDLMETGKNELVVEERETGKKRGSEKGLETGKEEGLEQMVDCGTKNDGQSSSDVVGGEDTPLPELFVAYRDRQGTLLSVAVQVWIISFTTIFLSKGIAVEVVQDMCATAACFSAELVLLEERDRPRCQLLKLGIVIVGFLSWASHETNMHRFRLWGGEQVDVEEEPANNHAAV